MNDYLAKPFQRSDLIRLLICYLPIALPAERTPEHRDPAGNVPAA